MMVVKCFKCGSREDVTIPSSGNKEIAMCGKCLDSGTSTSWEEMFYE